MIIAESAIRKVQYRVDLSRALLVGDMRSSVIIHRVKGGKTYGRANNPRGVGARYSLSQDACTRRSRHGGRASPGTARTSRARPSGSVRTTHDGHCPASESTPA